MPGLERVSMKHTNDGKTFTDPVCGMAISRLTAAAEYEHHGKTYYFCAPVCQRTFAANPDTYIRHHRQHGLKPAE